MAQQFLRARSPDQKAQRREAILAAAGRLLEAQDADKVTLAAIATEAGVVKSAIYRYFPSREAILIEILLADTHAAITAGEAELQAIAADTLDARVGAVATTFAAAFARRPRLCFLVSVLASVLENNLSHSDIAAFKSTLLVETQRAIMLIYTALPELAEGAGERAAFHMHVLVAGLWPFSNPTPIVAEVMERPEFAPFRKDFETTLRDGIATHLRGLLAERA
ncbi:MAG: TetR family transcriptional regulator [Pseudomonadota bacterium]